MPFRAWRCLNFDENVTKVCSDGNNKRKVITGSNNGSEVYVQMMVYWRTYASLGLDKLRGVVGAGWQTLQKWNWESPDREQS